MSDPTRAEVLVNVFGRTDVGRTREHNEDCFVVADLSTNVASLQPSVRSHRVGERGTLFMVADGMGGAAAGEIASQMATDIVLRELHEQWLPLQEPTGEAFARCLKRAVQSANQQIHHYATTHQEYRGMGTTATIAGVLGDTLYLCQIGDSRGYLVRDGEAKQITKDQSLMQKLIEAGELTEEEAAQSERRNIILQALGPEATIKVDLTYQQLRKGDTLVLCSDGLSGQIVRDDISRVVSGNEDLVQACKKLIDLANEAGGPDNITVIIARFDGEGLDAAGDEDDVGHHVFSLSDGSQSPPIAMDRITEGPTQPLVGSRRTAPLADAQDDAINDAHDDAQSGTPDAATLDSIDTAPFNAKRRSRGMTVAIALLVLLIAFGAWYAWRTMQKVAPVIPGASADSAAATPPPPPATTP
ncbi:MAG: Stp1/IreP family PP2C-type Ser/Thr phosphatase [Gemmatimonadaceae bacterium]